jgi:hypothetical protein
VKNEGMAEIAQGIVEEDQTLYDLSVNKILSFQAAAATVNSTASNSSVISHEVKFEIISSGNITPTWKLVRVSANTNAASGFFAASRDRTNDLLITLAPATPPQCENLSEKYSDKFHMCCPSGATKPEQCTKPTLVQNLELGTAGFSSALASEIGLAVANSIRALP